MSDSDLRMVDDVPEVDYVEKCPGCGCHLIGMSPEEFRQEHAPDCDPLLSLYHFEKHPGVMTNE